MGLQALELPKGICGPVEIGSLGAFYETSRASDKVLETREERLISSLFEALNIYVLAVVNARTVPEFRNERRRMWPKYARALRALHDTFVNVVPEAITFQLSMQAMANVEKTIQSRGVEIFGGTLTDQALFTLFTIGEIRALAREITNIDVPPSKRQEDVQLAREYHQDSLWAQFHLDALLAAIRFDRHVAEDIRDGICEGLRAAVNAYAIMKDAAALRVPSIDPIRVAGLPWDAEDEGLLSSSMRDANVDLSDNS